MSADLEQVERLIEVTNRVMPGLNKTCCPRSYDNLGNFYHPKIAGSALSNAVMAAEIHGMSMPGIRNQFVVAALNDSHKVPTFFVTDQLLRAVDQTELPEGMKWTDIPMPHPGMTFVFERGSVTHPSGFPVAFSCIGRAYKDDIIRHRMAREEFKMMNGGFMAITGCHTMPGFEIFDLVMNETNSPYIADAVKIHEEKNQRPITSYLEKPLSTDEMDFNQWIAILSIKLVLAMNAKPELVSVGSLQRSIKPKRKGDPRREYWTPNIVGRNYTSVREPVPGGAIGDGTAQVRLHWRRGHFRQQVHGEGRKLRKTLWIEPVLCGTLKD